MERKSKASDSRGVKSASQVVEETKEKVVKNPLGTLEIPKEIKVTKESMSALKRLVSLISETTTEELNHNKIAEEVLILIR